MAQAALAGAGGLMGAAGAIQQGQAESVAAEMNAQQAERNATMALARSAEQERRARIEGTKVLGDMRAGYGASGVTLEGSPLDVLQESAQTAELDALNIRYEGQAQAVGFRNEAKLERMRGASAKTRGYFSAASSLLSAGGAAADKIPSSAKGKKVK